MTPQDFKQKRNKIIVNCLICETRGIYDITKTDDSSNFVFMERMIYANDEIPSFAFYLCPNCFYKKDLDKMVDKAEEILRPLEDKS